MTRTQCHLTKQIIVGENRTSGVDLIFLDERLHEIRAAIDWTPPKGRSPSATNKLDEDVRLLHDAITLKYPNALRKEWKPQRQHNAPYKHSYTWSMSSGTIELVNRLPYTSGNIIELNIESEATKQLRVAFEAAKSRESLLRAEMHSRESAESGHNAV